jgi:hypothetical protein
MVSHCANVSPILMRTDGGRRLGAAKRHGRKYGNQVTRILVLPSLLIPQSVRFLSRPRKAKKLCCAKSSESCGLPTECQGAADVGSVRLLLKKRVSPGRPFCRRAKLTDSTVDD